MKTKSKLYIHYRSQLQNIAERFTDSCSYPIDILSLCKKLGISFTIDSKSFNKATLTANEKQVNIELSKDYYSKIYSPYVRYIVAHEIGHYILQFHLKATAVEKEYWVFEELCDFFSRSLLIPRQKIIPSIDHVKNDLYLIQELSKEIAQEYNVTRITSIQRIKDFINDFLFINLKNVKNTSTFVVNKSLLLKRKYLNGKLEIPNKYYSQFCKKVEISSVLSIDETEFIIFKEKFPLFFREENKMFLIVFDQNNISFMTINYAQQDV